LNREIGPSITHDDKLAGNHQRGCLAREVAAKKGVIWWRKEWGARFDRDWARRDRLRIGRDGPGDSEHAGA